MAKKKISSITANPLYAGFVKRYAMDLPRFCVEVLRMAPTWQQLLLFDSLQRPGSRTTVASGHGSGKTQALAAIAWWHLTCFPMSNTILSGPKLEILLTGVRKYFADMLPAVQDSPYGWVADHVVIAHKTIYMRGFKSQWWVTAKTAPSGKPEAIAGEHRKFLLWLIDEASGIDDKIMGVIMGSLTEDWNRIALMSQPTRASGFFYDTHHRLSELYGGNWRAITMNSEESPLVNDSFIREKRLAYGGVNDPQYKIKVRGEFPDVMSGQLLSRRQLEDVIDRPCSIPMGKEWGWLISVDVAAGEFRDKSVVCIAKVSGSGLHHEADPRRVHIVKFAVISSAIQPHELLAVIRDENGKVRDARILVDWGGLGAGVVKNLEALGLTNVVKVIWGNPCFKKAYKEAYFNLRSQAMVCAAKAAIHGHLTIEPGAFPDMASRNEFLDQHRVPYHFDDMARYRIESKGSKEWEGIPSPDILDAVSFLFLEGAHFIPHDGDADDGSAREQAMAGMSAALDAALEAA